MAKGNDGNLFQHLIEVEAASFLMKSSAPGGLYFATTHAMAPSEAFDTRQSTAAARASTALRSKLRVASGLGADAHLHPRIIQAFADLGASATSYPNSARLLEWVAKKKGTTLGGVLVELNPHKAVLLRDYFSGSSIRIMEGSWRQHLDALRPPEDLGSSWLFSMDPMKFTSGRDHDNDKMTRADFARLIPLWTNYAARLQPGLVAIFSYSMQRDQREHFLSELVTHLLPSLPGWRLGVLEAVNYTSDYHVAALLSADQGVLAHVRDRVLANMPRARDRDSFSLPHNIFKGGA